MTQNIWHQLPAEEYNKKGDLTTSDAGGVPSLLSVGANETNLEADSNEATGLKWSSRAKDAEIIAYLGL